MMQIALRHPGLVLPAVQFAIIDKDPVPGFTATIKRVRQLWKEQLRQTKDTPVMEKILQSRPSSHWGINE
jgi:hypothetical protein